MKLKPEIVQEFIDLYAREFGETLDECDAEVWIRQLFDLYRSLHEWHYDREHRPEPQTGDAGS